MEENPRIYNSSLYELPDELPVNMASFRHRKVAMREQLTDAASCFTNISQNDNIMKCT